MDNREIDHSTYWISLSYCNFSVFSCICLAAACILLHIGKDHSFLNKDPIWKWSKNYCEKFAFWKEVSFPALQLQVPISIYVFLYVFISVCLKWVTFYLNLKCCFLSKLAVSPPTRLRYNVVSPDSVQISWKAPKGQFTGYKLLVTPSSGKSLCVLF